MENNRFIIYHKQAASARLLFLALNKFICHFDRLPSGSKIVNSEIDRGQIVEDPADIIATVKARLAISEDILKLETKFQAIAQANDTTFPIYLVNLNTVDPPREQIAHLEGKFISIMEARSLPPIESELLGLVYSFLMD